MNLSSVRILLCNSWGWSGGFRIFSTLGDTHPRSNGFDNVGTGEIGRSLVYILCFLIYC